MTHENDEIKSTAKMSTYIWYNIGAVVLIWITEVGTIMKLLCVKGSLSATNRKDNVK